MHRSAKCRYKPRDQKIGKQRKNEQKREEKGNEREMDLFRNTFLERCRKKATTIMREIMPENATVNEKDRKHKAVTLFCH